MSSADPATKTSKKAGAGSKAKSKAKSKDEKESDEKAPLAENVDGSDGKEENEEEDIIVEVADHEPDSTPAPTAPTPAPAAAPITSSKKALNVPLNSSASRASQGAGRVSVTIKDHKIGWKPLDHKAAAAMDWPTLIELDNLMKEKSMEELDKISGGMGALAVCARLGVDPQKGLKNPVADWDKRVEKYGENKFEEKTLTPYWKYLLEQLQQPIIILLLCMATLELVVKGFCGGLLKYSNIERTSAIAEACVLYMTVSIICNIAAFLDWKRERMFEALTKRLAQSNLRFVVRDGVQITVTDQNICVGDVLSFNAHMAPVISCDGLLLSGEDVKCDESALTGEPEPISKMLMEPFMISGTTVNAGSGTMLVVAVGANCIAGKIQKAVYGDGAEDEKSPLYQKLDTMAKNIGKVGTVAALTAMVATFIWTYGIDKKKSGWLAFDIILQTVGILACAIPEGLPLALVIALALTSNKMGACNNLVKTLNSCETMGSATTICTDKTGTLTTNRMTVRAAYIDGALYPVEKPAEGAEGQDPGPRMVADNRVPADRRQLVGELMCVCTMDESGYTRDETGKLDFQGNPTECALLKMAEDLGYKYKQVRDDTVGRSAATISQGTAKVFSSARKMMSWAVPRPDGTVRVYAKGASEIILTRVTRRCEDGKVVPMTEADTTKIFDEVISKFADKALRTIGLAYKDVDAYDGDALHKTILNTDGSQAYNGETDLTFVGVVGIEDPLRKEVGPAIQRCFKAGIDVRMVTGDNLSTAIAIAKDAGILNPDLHCDKAGNVLPKRAMEGRTFRKVVHDHDAEGVATFNQAKFDEVWPFLRVLARSSPDDKLTLAKGLKNSLIYQDRALCDKLRAEEKVTIFPDRQVVAMTGDGTNDAPALRNADVGFAMGIAGTQIAKDAANIILLDDNFASIVVAAKWGRNVFDSIQKFLQFQLTVNISILSMNVICALFDKECPLTVLHLLWLNLIMDSAASVALASEPPTDALLERPPVNRNDPIITRHMLVNMVGMAVYEVSLMIGLVFNYKWIPDLIVEPDDPITGHRSRHITILFNLFVFMQICNEYNSRFLGTEWKIWIGLKENPLFLGISFGTVVFQVVMVQLAAPILTYALKIHPKGLSIKQWLLCIGFSLGTFVVRAIFNGFQILLDNMMAPKEDAARLPGGGTTYGKLAEENQAEQAGKE